MVYFTASHPKFKCGICKQLDSELSTLAQSYAKSRSGDDTEPSVFFLRLDYESSQRVFQNYGVNSVPLMFHIPAHSGADRGDKDYVISPRDRYQILSDPDAEGLASFLHERTGVSVKITRSMFWSYVLLIAVFAFLAALVQPIINSLPFWLRLVQWRPLWMTVSYGIYTCAISGMIFDIIRSPQM